MNKLWRKLDNNAKIFSLDEKKNNNTFRLSAILNEPIDIKLLNVAVNKTLENYPIYKVKLKSGFFWKYLKNNDQDPIVELEEGITCKNINHKGNNEYLFKVTYNDNKINLDIFHVLTDGVGAINFFKIILYNYFDLKYQLKSNNNINNIEFNPDEYLKNANTRLRYINSHNKAYIIKEKSNKNNKTTHYVLNLEILKLVCKKNNASISEYLTAIYIYAIYKSLYDKTSNKDIIISIPIDLRKHFNVETFSNFFTCMNIEGKILNNPVSFESILDNVKEEFQNKLTLDNIKKYLARDVKLGTNIGIRLIPLSLKKKFIKYFGRLVTQNSTSTVSNIGSIKVDNQYKKYIDNIIALVSVGRFQKIKCTVCSYQNNLTVTINSNLINNKLENEFYKLLKQYIGKVTLINNLY